MNRNEPEKSYSSLLITQLLVGSCRVDRLFGCSFNVAESVRVLSVMKYFHSSNFDRTIKLGSTLLPYQLQLCKYQLSSNRNTVIIESLCGLVSSHLNLFMTVGLKTCPFYWNLDSGVQEVLAGGIRNLGKCACGIRNPGLWNPEYSSMNLESL